MALSPSLQKLMNFFFMTWNSIMQMLRWPAARPPLRVQMERAIEFFW